MTDAIGEAPGPRPPVGVPREPADDLRDYLSYEVQYSLAAADPRLTTSRCTRCGIELPTTQLIVIKHRTAQAEKGYLGTYCLEHIPTREHASSEDVGTDVRANSVICPNCWLETATATGRCVHCETPLNA